MKAIGVVLVILVLEIVSLLTGCAGNGSGNPLPIERVIDRNSCLDIGYCAPFAPYYRLGTDPQSGMAFWLISNQGHGCLVDGQDFVRVVDGTMYPCAWRFARP